MPKKRKPGAGRPPKPANSRKDGKFQAKCTLWQEARAKAAAAKAEVTLTDLIVSSTMAAAEEILAADAE
jgi:uncharacterized protein (DUF1778 family)